MATNWLTSATLTGAYELNYIHHKAAQEDLGFKIEKAISAINEIQTSVSTLNQVVSALVLAAVSASDSAATWSAFSGYTTSTTALTVTALSNFRASHPA